MSYMPAYKKCLCHYHTSYSYIYYFYQQFGLRSSFFCRWRVTIYTTLYIYIIYNIYNTNSLIKGNGLQLLRMYSNHMFLLLPSMAVGAAFSWLYLALCHQTTFYDILPPLNMYNIPALLHSYTNTSSYMVKYLCISSYIRKPFLTLQPIPAEFPYIWGKLSFLF